MAEVEFRAWTADGILRHASFRGLREDKPAGEIVRETATGGSAKPPQRSPVKLTHPDRLYWPDAGRDQGRPRRLLCRGLALYRALHRRPAAGAGALPGRHRRPKFFQKHAWKGLNRNIQVRDPTEAPKRCWPSTTSTG